MKRLLILVLFTLRCIATPSDSAKAQTPAVRLPPNYHLVFNESFQGPLSVSNYGPGTTWIAHTPYGGDFGDAWFGLGSSTSGSPFSTGNGILTIKAWFDTISNHWRSGLLSSVDPQAVGFSQALGYWECKLQWLGGLGTWPAFWLDGLGWSKTPKTNVAEIDILEAYGVNTSIAHQAVHVWSPSGSQLSSAGNQTTHDLTSTPHVFSCLINKDFIHYYIDGQEVWSTPTPAEAKQPLYCMVDLALGGGWPITNTPNPSYMYVYYVRCWAR
jgi:Glycosyl hydrolases family 16